ncbi:MAG: protein phosphatase 2C domain-containing protein [Thermoanaerobaculia bacterium]|nr:protein phosphatase 2C domain-containing protein [Thermoanaerobaculia bacterium]MBP9825160.1 protein phosphatase 2C domain-containing protein [Thermoanaerobaculia bacterium]
MSPLPRRGSALAVADGMGGHRAGDVASREATEAFSRAVKSSPKGETPEARLRRSFRAAAVGVAAAAARDSGSGDMGTTLVAALFDGGEVWVAHAGDSQAVLVCGDEVHVLTRPHTHVEEQLARGEISETQALASPFRHAVVRALGKEPVEPDIERVDESLWGMPPGAVLLLASDGVMNHVGQPEVIELLMGGADLDAGVRAMVLRAIENGSDDNATAAALEFGRFPRRRGALAVRAAAVLGAVVLAVALAAAIFVLRRVPAGLSAAPLGGDRTSLQAQATSAPEATTAIGTDRPSGMGQLALEREQSEREFNEKRKKIDAETAEEARRNQERFAREAAAAKAAEDRKAEAARIAALPKRKIPSLAVAPRVTAMESPGNAAGASVEPGAAAMRVHATRKTKGTLKILPPRSPGDPLGGTVRIKFNVSASGEVQDARIVQSPSLKPELRKRLEGTAKDLAFIPASDVGLGDSAHIKPVPVDDEVTLDLAWEYWSRN